MSITLRVATPKDAEALANIGRKTFIQTFGHLYSPDNLNAYLDGNFSSAIQKEELSQKDQFHMLVESAGVVIGFSKAGPNKLPVQNPLQPAYELQRIYVLPEYAGQGVGEKLIAANMDFFKKQGAEGIYVGVWENNLRAQQFYRKHGFQVIGNYNFMVGHHSDNELIMQYNSRKE